MSRSVSIGCGSAYADDWLDPGVDLANSGQVQYMIFDCLAERTMALAHIRRLRDENSGQDQRIQEVVRRFGDYLRGGGRIIGSFGAANPRAAGDEVIGAVRKHGLDGLRVGTIYGDDVREAVTRLDLELPEMGCRVSELNAPMVSANAYIGADAIVPLLQEGCAIILGGRIADPSPYVAVLSHEFGWQLEDWPRMGAATLVGHLLECGIHGCGGNFNDPPYRFVPDVANVGVPMAIVSDDGEILITKLASSGGAMNEQVCKTQLLYEIHDPAAYLTPDVTADFSHVTVTDLGRDRVRVDNASGRARPDTLKVLIGLDLGWKVVGEGSYGGAGAVDRARFAADVLRQRMTPYADAITEMRIDMHGLNAVSSRPDHVEPAPPEVRLRFAARVSDEATAQVVARQTEFMYFATAGAGGVVHSVVPAIGVTPAFLPRETLHLQTEVITA